MPSPSHASWQLEPPSTAARFWLFAIAVLLPAGIAVGALSWAARDSAPQRLAGSGDPAAAAIVAGVLLACLALHWAVARALRRHGITLDEDGLAIRTTFYARKLAWNELLLQQARVVDLREHTGLKPLLKTNGTSLPGLRSGWFRLRNRRKALVAMAGRGTRVVHLPTTQGYDLLLKPRHPPALLQRLRELAPAVPRR